MTKRYGTFSFSGGYKPQQDLPEMPGTDPNAGFKGVRAPVAGAVPTRPATARKRWASAPIPGGGPGPDMSRGVFVGGQRRRSGRETLQSVDATMGRTPHALVTLANGQQIGGSPGRVIQVLSQRRNPNEGVRAPVYGGGLPEGVGSPDGSVAVPRMAGVEHPALDVQPGGMGNEPAGMSPGATPQDGFQGVRAPVYGQQANAERTNTFNPQGFSSRQLALHDENVRLSKMGIKPSQTSKIAGINERMAAEMFQRSGQQAELDNALAIENAKGKGAVDVAGVQGNTARDVAYTQAGSARDVAGLNTGSAERIATGESQIVKDDNGRIVAVRAPGQAPTVMPQPTPRELMTVDQGGDKEGKYADKIIDAQTGEEINAPETEDPTFASIDAKIAKASARFANTGRDTDLRELQALRTARANRANALKKGQSKQENHNVSFDPRSQFPDAKLAPDGVWYVEQEGKRFRIEE